MNTAPHSLRRRLLLSLLAAVALFALLQGAGAWRAALRQTDALFDQHLRQIARTLRDGATGLGFDDESDGLEIQIWGINGLQLFRSPRSALPQIAMLGFSDVTVHGTRYRVYAVQAQGRTVQVAQDRSARDARARALALRTALPAALLAPLLMLVVWWVVSRSLAPLAHARAQLARRNAGDLTPLAEADLPEEVRPLVHELNQLFARVDAAFESQRHFVADAAHELRSPLTALKLQAQALRGSADEAAVARLNRGIDRAVRLAEQLLALARAEAAPAPHGSVDLTAVVRLALADVLTQAQAADIDLGLAEDSAPGPVLTQGQPEALRMLLRNLLDNALKYTPAGGRVDVALHPENGAWLLTVDDSGPGIPEAERARVFDRFYRVNDGAAVSGSGLGLTIVHAIAQAHGTQVQLLCSPRLGGLRVELRLPQTQTHAPAASAGHAGGA